MDQATKDALEKIKNMSREEKEKIIMSHFEEAAQLADKVKGSADTPGAAMLNVYAAHRMLEMKFLNLWPEKKELWEKSREAVDKIIDDLRDLDLKRMRDDEAIH